MSKKDHPLKTLARLGWQPTLLALVTAVEGLINTLFVAHIGLAAIASVTIAGSVLLIQQSITSAVGSTTRYFTSTAKSRTEALKIIIQGAVLSCLVSLALGCMTIILAKVLIKVYGVEVTSDG